MNGFKELFQSSKHLCCFSKPFLLRISVLMQVSQTRSSLTAIEVLGLSSFSVGKLLSASGVGDLDYKFCL